MDTVFIKRIFENIYNKRFHPLYIPGLFFAVLIRCLSPWLNVRLMLIGMDRVGNLYPFLWYLVEKEGQRPAVPVYDIHFFSPHTDVVSNTQWKKMVEGRARIFPFRRIIWPVYKWLHFIPGGRQHLIRYPVEAENRVLQACCAREKPFFSFSEDEEMFGQRELQRIGLPPGASFICFHSRDSYYLNKTQPGNDWAYHDYRDSKIENYAGAIEKYLEDKDCYAVRMGALVQEPLATKHPRIIDYAANGSRTDFLDVYLSAKCRFFLGTDCGLTIFPEVFRRPVIVANKVSICYMPRYMARGVVILKKWFLKTEKRFMTLEEIFKFRIQDIKPRELGITLIENTPEEILAAMEEVDAMLEGGWKSSADDERMQKRFWELFGKEKWHAPMLRVGQKFLQDNAGLFGLLTVLNEPGVQRQ